MRTPKYQVIEKDLKQHILDGTYPAGTIIPKELELAARYGVSRPTVRQAIQNLVEQGLLEKKRKRGTMVRQNKIRQEFTHIIESYNQEMHDKGLTTITKVLNFRTEAATPEVADSLQLKPGDQVFKLVRLRYAGTTPIVLVTTYLPYQPLRDLANLDFTKASLYTELAKREFAITRVRRKLEVQAADETTSALLDVPTASPLFYFHTFGDTTCDRRIEYSIASYRGDTNYFVFDIDNSNNNHDLLNF